MKTLTKAEEEIMQVLWRIGGSFLKDITNEMPEPKPHQNTVATILKISGRKEIRGYRSIWANAPLLSFSGKGSLFKRKGKIFGKKLLRRFVQ